MENLDFNKLIKNAKRITNSIDDLDSNIKDIVFGVILGKLMEIEIQFDYTEVITKSIEIKTENKKDLTIEIDEATKYLEKKALYMLLIAKENKIQGLISPQISDLLKDIFNTDTKPKSISVELMKSIEFVDRDEIKYKNRKTFFYYLSDKGTDEIVKELANFEN